MTDKKDDTKAPAHDRPFVTTPAPIPPSPLRDIHRRHQRSGEQVFHLHLVSDSTGETLEAILSAALVQFEGVKVHKHFWPLIRSAMQMERLLDDIREEPGLVMYTLVNPEIRTVLEDGCAAADLPALSILDPVINLLGSYFGKQARNRPGRQHIMDRRYFDRIDALHYTLAHDDGVMTEDLWEADIILVGVSRSSKTPTSIYLANKGYKTANVPFVPDLPMPSELDRMTDRFIIGLTASPERLSQIRTNRLRAVGENGNGDYTDLDTIRDEVKACRRYCSAHGWPVLDVTRRSIEESAAAILNRYHLWREERGLEAEQSR
ncbi:pyruvate, water dikinase regulatory protein [Yunchengibacter salinarum]|uniref:pyruvate, water dikinase regulatory protein n=1 Tax=Yunchengibacter salinarum TaxID=3133399 RepID=UPI0035B67DCA